MLKKIILTIGLGVVSVNAIAGEGCHKPEVVTVKDLTIMELKEYRKGLIELKEKANFDKEYTYTHNRIYKKSLDIRMDNKLAELKETNNDNNDKLKKIDLIEQKGKETLENKLAFINYKTDIIHKYTVDNINKQLKEVDNEIKERNKLIMKNR